ncbi:MAG: DUF4835 family protein [Chitinophagales bacterium]|nr:DUF4835 family protein [Chitinophagales bacterium]
MLNNRFLLSTFLILCGISISAQELDCKVQVNAQKVKSVDAKIFKEFESAVFEFMNNRNWTGDVFSEKEKIECSIFITIDSELGNDRYSATAAIQLSRPVYNTDYNSTILNMIDQNWEFEYTEFQPLDFNENVYVSNLTSMLAFYAYVFIGMDYDTYSEKGGSEFFNKAESILTSVPSSAPKGWKPFDGQRNRYWLITDILNSRLSGLREAMYTYHLKGLDHMYDDAAKAKTTVLEALEQIRSAHEEKPTSYLIQIFIDAKEDEIVNLYSVSPNQEKLEVLKILSKINPTESNEYSRKLMGK